ncbi:YciI family protein [Nonomuraea typhae]|uniref:YciI family protein n=1 Tax=Nonomuraea typhae TaxID=2603600 RepID=A0ABW7Z8K4_9ACTN
MKYALLLYGDAEAWAQATPEQRERSLAAHQEYIEMLVKRDAILGGEELAVPGPALKLSKGEDGSVLRTDGPFAETIEHLGGFYVIEAADLDEAIELAKACPEPIVEVRPVVEHTG